jgi:acyl phosphate:glycerol-3-phosphate acyltransferase
VEYLSYFVAAIGAYFLGSIPTGYLVARAKGVDIRTVGSGNIGATNVFRIVGKPAGVFVLAFDALKGFLACVWMPLLAFGIFAPKANPAVVSMEHLSIIAGMFAVLGHNYPCWLRFKGGKGIATSAGVLIALVPWALMIILTVWIILFALTRYVSLGSVSAAFTLPFAVWLTGGSWTMIGITALLGVLAIYKHRGNIQRLISGTEPRIGSAKSPSTP